MLVRLATPDGANISEIAWSPDALRVVIAGDDGTLRLWDAAGGRRLCSVYILDAGKGWLLVSPGGRLDGSEMALGHLVAWRRANTSAWTMRSPDGIVSPICGWHDAESASRFTHRILTSTSSFKDERTSGPSSPPEDASGGAGRGSS
jgi:WD40 repeat protein